MGFYPSCLRGYKVERALIGRPSSLNLPAQQTLYHSECVEVLHHIFGIASPEAGEGIQNPERAPHLRVE